MNNCRNPEPAEPNSPDATCPGAQPLSARLRALHAEQPIAISALARELGTRVHRLALFIVALPETLPLPVPSIAPVLAVPLAAISLHLMLHGEDGRLPVWLGRYRLPPRLVGVAKSTLASLVARGESLSRPRWSELAGRERVVGGLCLMLSVILLLPVPLFNIPPAVCLSLLAWGLVQRDGVFVALGAVGSVLVLGLLILGLSGLSDLAVRLDWT